MAVISTILGPHEEDSTGLVQVVLPEWECEDTYHSLREHFLSATLSQVLSQISHMSDI